MTSTISPNDTGDIRPGETRDLTYVTQRPALRRPDATGEFAFYRPRAIGDVDELARLALGATLVHQLPLPPLDSLPEAIRRPAPTTHRAVPPELQPARPPGYRGTRRMVEPPADLLLPLLALGVVGAALMIAVQVALLQVAIRVSGAVL